MSKSKAEKFTTAAIAAIQSPSMREWASSAHNLPIVTKMAVAAIAKNPRTKPADFATYLTLVAMG
jgi:hypothetical protein